MENLLADILLIERKTLCSFLIKNGVSNDRFQLWRNVLKPVILDSNLDKIEALLIDRDICLSHIRCRQCGEPLKWVDMDIINAEEIYFVCTECPSSKPILKCNIEETAKILIDLIKGRNPQIIASAIKLMIISGNLLNSISPPEIPDNPFKAFKSICETSPNSLKFGGTKAVIMADVYENYSICEFPILYVADTISIPTRYFFHILKFKSPIFNPQKDRNEHSPCVKIPKYQEEYLVKELTEIANLYIKSGSYLVLGHKLQHIISPEYYANCRKHNLSIIVPLSSLCSLDKHSKRQFDITENFGNIIAPAIKICEIVQTVVTNCNKQRTHEALHDYLNLHLTVVTWLLTFYDTPFESMIYHIINLNET